MEERERDKYEYHTVGMYPSQWELVAEYACEFGMSKTMAATILMGRSVAEYAMGKERKRCKK